MGGLYLHIPFCISKCHYCDFYSVTKGYSQEEFTRSLIREMELRKDYLNGQSIDTVYIGGGTPTLLRPDLLKQILINLKSLFPVAETAEITIEANPDDLTPSLPHSLTPLLLTFGFNRISIGIQSFHNHHLTYMNRRHDAHQAEAAVWMAKEAGFGNISIDLIYGIPGMTAEEWEFNLMKANGLPAVHLSAYHLTIEPGTRFGKLRKAGLFTEAGDADSLLQYRMLREISAAGGYEQYEISNFARNQLYSRHNSKYWTGEGYLGLGPSAHSYNGDHRHWNPASLKAWLAQIAAGKEPKGEAITRDMKRNEYVMTRLRTSAGIQKKDFIARFGEGSWSELEQLAGAHIASGALLFNGEKLVFDSDAWFRSDGILADLFV